MSDQKPEFRGTWIPAEIFHALESGDINTTKFALLCVIDSMVKSRGIGCFASSRTLGAKVGIKPRQVFNLIDELIDSGFVIKRTSTQYPRLLETIWSRAGEPMQKIAGGYAKNCTGGMQKIAVEISKEKSKREGSGKLAAPPPRDNGFLNGRPVDTECLKWAAQLRDAVRKAGQQYLGSDRKGAEHFRLLRDVDKQKDINAVLKYYCRHAGEWKAVGLPDISSAAQFRQRWSWIKGQYDAALEKGTEDPPEYEYVEVPCGVDRKGRPLTRKEKRLVE